MENVRGIIPDVGSLIQEAPIAMLAIFASRAILNVDPHSQQEEPMPTINPPNRMGLFPVACRRNMPAYNRLRRLEFDDAAATKF